MNETIRRDCLEKEDLQKGDMPHNSMLGASSRLAPRRMSSS